LLFLGLLIVSLIYLLVVRKPTTVEIQAFVRFITVEVGTALFVKNLPALIPILIIGSLPVWAWYIPFVALSGLGWLNAVRYYYYYYVSAGYPGIVSFVDLLLSKYEFVGQHLRYFFPVCTAVGGCSPAADEKANLMIGLWYDDAWWLLFVLISCIVLDGIRYRQNPFTLAGVVVLAVTLGWDTVAPIWFIWLVQRERIFATFGEPKIDFLMSNGGGIVLYAILALASVSSWWIPLLDWAVTRGTVSGQLEDGLKNPFGARATILIMGTFWVWTIVWLPQLKISQTGNAIADNVCSYVIRTLMIFLFMGHVAGAASTILLFREFAVNATYASGAGDAGPSPTHADDKSKTQ